MSKMLAELEEAGYVKRKEQPRGAAGRFAKAGYLVSRKPIFRGTVGTGPKNQDTVPPSPDSPYTEEPYTKNSPQLNTKQSNTPYSPPEGDEPAPADKPKAKAKNSRRGKSAPVHDPEAFETFWKAYPRKDDRKAAIRAWDKLKPDRELCRVMYAALKRQRSSEQWAEADGRYIPMFSTWLNGRKWENQGVDLSLLSRRQDNSGSWAPDRGMPS